MRATETKAGRDALAWFAWGVLGFLLLVVLWGAFVRTSGSGGGCGANWPLCNGDFFPHHPRLATVIEFTHRSMTGVCTALVAALGAWIFYATERGHRARRAWVWSAVLLVMEALLGAVLVLRGYVEQNVSMGRIAMQSIHFTNTLLLIAAVTLTAWFLSGRESRSGRMVGRQRFFFVPEPHANPLRVSLARGMGTVVVWGFRALEPRNLATISIVATIVVGATGSLAALADTLFPSPSVAAGLMADFAASSPLLVRMRWMHPAAAVVALVCALMLAGRLRPFVSAPERVLMRASESVAERVLIGLVVVQVALGIGDVLLLAPTWMQVLHLLGADLFWVALVVVAAEVWWNGTGSVEAMALRR